MKSITYAYPTSDNARQHGHSREGCWIVRSNTGTQAFPTSQGHLALNRFDMLSDHTADDSFLGSGDPCPTEERRHQIINSR